MFLIAICLIAIFLIAIFLIGIFLIAILLMAIFFIEFLKRVWSGKLHAERFTGDSLTMALWCTYYPTVTLLLWAQVHVKKFRIMKFSRSSSLIFNKNALC